MRSLLANETAEGTIPRPFARRGLLAAIGGAASEDLRSDIDAAGA
ncbi:MAG: hypothetical protein WBB44_02580 [Candidatus Nanopelagicales bacterium]